MVMPVRFGQCSLIEMLVERSSIGRSVLRNGAGFFKDRLCLFLDWCEASCACSFWLACCLWRASSSVDGEGNRLVGRSSFRRGVAGTEGSMLVGIFSTVP